MYRMPIRRGTHPRVTWLRPTLDMRWPTMVLRALNSERMVGKPSLIDKVRFARHPTRTRSVNPDLECKRLITTARCTFSDVLRSEATGLICYELSFRRS